MISSPHDLPKAHRPALRPCRLVTETPFYRMVRRFQMTTARLQLSETEWTLAIAASIGSSCRLLFQVFLSRLRKLSVILQASAMGDLAHAVLRLLGFPERAIGRVGFLDAN